MPAWSRRRRHASSAAAGAVGQFADYGRLSHLDKRELKPGARVASDEYSKDDVRDFALWKAAAQEDEHDPGLVGPREPPVGPPQRRLARGEVRELPQARVGIRPEGSLPCLSTRSAS